MPYGMDAFMLGIGMLVSVAQAALLPRALWQFGNVIKCAVSTNNPFKYNDYGCWCGFGGSGTPVDQVDSCCKAHDMCYRESRSIPACRPLVDSPYITVYDYTCTNKQVTCDSSNSACQKFICECDRVAAHCFSQAPYNEQFKGFDKKKHCNA
ncbi:UNVERIFIED_CONTAM: hypothetical protein FKN15_031284 [Acipenser sinensis]